MMIDHALTFTFFGYHVDSLTRQSGKRVVAICDECATMRSVVFQAYRDLCYRCSLKYRIVPRTPEIRKKIGDAQRGEKNHMFGVHRYGKDSAGWKGGITPVMHRVRRSPAYKNWRTAVFKRDDYTCQMCKTRGGKLEAHHIRPVREHKNDLVMWDISNGITLCKKCHGSTKNREHEFIDKFEVILS